MLLKLSISGIKARLRDYLVLFSGLLVASGIFYMFESLASNKAFLEANTTVSSVVIIFRLGSVLLAIITFVYILYANSFLLNMRQKEYGMFLMLGAKVKKIAQLIFLETFLVGFLATLMGSLVGIALTKGVSLILINQLQLSLTHFQPVSPKALLETIVFFSILFFLAAVFNAQQIRKKTLLSLLKDGSTPAPGKRNLFGLLLQSLIGIGLLAAGYYLMSDLVRFQIAGIFGALFTILGGTFLIFHALLLVFVNGLKNRPNVAFRRLNNFTLSQLNFRLQDYSRVLSLVAMLFALALGALTVGIGFKNDIMKITKQSTAYDLVLNNAQAVSAGELSKLDITKEATYQQKSDGTTLYYNQADFDQEPLLITDYGVKGYQRVSGEELVKDLNKQDELRNLETPERQALNLQILSPSDFAALNLPTTELKVIQVKDFADSIPQLKKLVKINEKNNPGLNSEQGYTQRVVVYELFNSLYSGFEFMGFFLGIAFLTMLASCLMFKILSGASQDIQRYQMLQKIGARQKLLKGSIKKELGLLFLAPGIVGAIHVLFGLKMFTTLLQNPYNGIALPFALFGIIYAGYYLLTVKLYEKIVLPPLKK
ncbi:ABC transporter permease [Enterococcus asini]|uniref:FtsX-like permease family protein n=1 Tax=Enterococcus asini TaxID=57732 RepID=UPI001E35E09F|nr:ABC transporter permease [Enterococcus asini]MCD5029286.1 ABC transporter permease [Enterococcus asini]MDT2784668.1 ABC transporter permease [Enterococcus asini]